MKMRFLCSLVLLPLSFCLTAAESPPRRGWSPVELKRRQEEKIAKAAMKRFEANLRKILNIAPVLMPSIKRSFLGGTDPAEPSFELKDDLYRVVARPDDDSYGQNIYAIARKHLYEAKTLEDAVVGVAALSVEAGKYRGKAKQYQSELDELGKSLLMLSNDAMAIHAKDIPRSLIEIEFHYAGKDELSFCLRRLVSALRKRDKRGVVNWSGEAVGVGARLTDSVRWIELHGGWVADLVFIFNSFEPCFKPSSAGIEAAGGWKNYMFGRCPGALSLQYYSFFEAVMVDRLLRDVMLTTDEEKMVMSGPTPRWLWPVAVTNRAAAAELIEGVPRRLSAALKLITSSKYELSSFNAAIWRYADGGKTGDLRESLLKFVVGKEEIDFRAVMEIIHLPQGAWGATNNTASDRYLANLAEWSDSLSGPPEEALKKAHKLAYDFYMADGEKHYRGGIMTLKEVFETGYLDCIRISQLMGCVFADAGYSGLHPVRIGRGDFKKKVIAASGHTFVCLGDYPGGDCLEGLSGKGWTGRYGEIYKNSEEVLSCGKGYRSLCSWVSGEMYFPQGPLEPVSLRIPYLNIERKGLPK